MRPMTDNMRLLILGLPDHMRNPGAGLLRGIIEAAVAEEREACARVAEEFPMDEIRGHKVCPPPLKIAAAIRARFSGVPRGTPEEESRQNGLKHEGREVSAEHVEANYDTPVVGNAPVIPDHLG